MPAYGGGMSATFRAELVPTWAKVAAWAVPLTTIPSVAWRLGNVLGGLGGGDPCVFPAGTPWWARPYLLGVQLAPLEPDG